VSTLASASGMDERLRIGWAIHVYRSLYCIQASHGSPSPHMCERAKPPRCTVPLGLGTIDNAGERSRLGERFSTASTVEPIRGIVAVWDTFDSR